MQSESIEKQNNNEDIREIPKWAKRYALNKRAIRVAGFIVVFILFFCAITGFSYLLGVAFRAGNTTLAWLYLTLDAITCVGLLVGSIYFAVPRWGGRKLERFADRLSHEEGYVALTLPGSKKRNFKQGVVVAILYAACIQVSVILGMYGYIPHDYIMPVSALYVVPFLLFLSIKLKPVAGLIPLLWPFLYTLHAVLIVAGTPILFTGKWTGLNMLLPTVGYGLLTSLIGFFYSRYALGKLKRLARIDAGQTERGSEAGDVL